MKKMGTFGKILAGLVVVLVIAIFTKTYWGQAAWAGIEWICDSLGVPAPTGIQNILDKENARGTNEPGMAS